MDLFLILFLAVFTIIILRRILTAFPERYFTVQDIVSTEHKDISLFGFLLRFPLIFFFSLIIAFFSKGNMRFIFLYSFFVSFLLIWPFILEKIIYRNKQQQYYSKGYIKKYMIVYAMYSSICILVSLLAVPVYNVINQKLFKSWKEIYGSFLEKYLTLDPLLQSLVSSLIVAILLIVPTFLIHRKLNRFCERNFT